MISQHAALGDQQESYANQSLYFKWEEKGMEVAIGPNNRTYKLIPSFMFDFIAIYSPKCKDCADEYDDIEESEKLGFFKYTSNVTETKKISFFGGSGLYLTGRWAEETINFPNKIALEKTYDKKSLTKVFMIEEGQIEISAGGVSMNITI
jgi:hypothetical protein